MNNFWNGFEKKAKEGWSKKTKKTLKYKTSRAVGVPLVAAGALGASLYGVDKKYGPKGNVGGPYG